MSCLRKTHWHRYFFYFTWHLYLWQQCFSDMTATFMTPVFFRHNSNIYDISVFSRHDIYIGPERNVNLICSWSLCTHIPQIKSISPSGKKWWQLITRPKIIGPKRNVNFIYISVFSRHDIYIDDIGVLFTWHPHSRHQCFSDISATFMTSVLFRHDIYIDDISGFVLDMTSTFMTSVYFSHDM
jgi:hypothetical protein